MSTPRAIGSAVRLRRLAAGLLKQNPAGHGINRKRQIAGSHMDFLAKALGLEPG